MLRTILIVTIATTVVCGCGSRRLQGYLDALGDSTTETDDTSDSPPDSEERPEGTDSVADASSAGTTSAHGSTSTTQTAGESDSDTTLASDTGTTAEPMLPACGNGILEPFGPVPEECDDGNLVPDDGCSETCALDRRVFVTSTRYHAYELMSPHIASGLCASTAAAHDFADPLTYKAWLSTSTEDARDRIIRGRGRLVLVNGLVFAKSWSALFAGEIDHPLEVNEKSETYHGGAWTGTRPDGTAVPDAEHCDDWTSKSAFTTGHWGRSTMTTAEWTLAVINPQPAPCISSYPIYCFQSL